MKTIFTILLATLALMASGLVLAADAAASAAGGGGLSELFEILFGRDRKSLSRRLKAPHSRLAPDDGAKRVVGLSLRPEASHAAKQPRSGSFSGLRCSTYGKAPKGSTRMSD